MPSPEQLARLKSIPSCPLPLADRPESRPSRRHLAHLIGRPMRIYLMARYGRREEMLAVAADLEKLGHTVTSRWILGAHELDDHLLNTDPAFRDREGARFAEEDLEDLLASDCALAFTEEPGIKHGRGRGGRHFEAGVAFACSVTRATGGDVVGPDRLIVVGHKENVFYCLDVWEHFPDWAECLTALAREWTPPALPARCPECGAHRRWERLAGGGLDAVCPACGRRGAHDEAKVPA